MKKLMVLSTLALATSLFAEPAKDEPIQVIEEASNVNQPLAEVGKMLWFDPRLSKSNIISCNSCHNLATGGVDNLPSSIGHHWTIGPINSPTVLNSDLNFVQFWNGRAKDLKEQAAGPISNPKEMAFSHDLAIDTINTIPEYRQLFKEIYNKDEASIDEITSAIAEFEKTLRTPNSPFDQWLKGDESALTQRQKEGYALFKAKGCTACHQGPLLGGETYQKFGLVKHYETDNPDIGRAAVTGKDEDKNMFKVPTLRNIELTYPYFHDGSVWDLKEAVNVMAEIQLGQKLTEDETAKITEFLLSLTGDQPEIVLPHLPPSTNKTPKPVLVK